MFGKEKKTYLVILSKCTSWRSPLRLTTYIFGGGGGRKQGRVTVDLVCVTLSLARSGSRQKKFFEIGPAFLKLACLKLML